MPGRAGERPGLPAPPAALVAEGKCLPLPRRHSETRQACAMSPASVHEH